MDNSSFGFSSQNMGHTFSLLTSLIITVLGISSIVMGIVILVKYSGYNSVSGIVKVNSVCNQDMTACITPVTYIVDGTTYNMSVNTNNKAYMVGSSINIYYQDCPTKPVANPVPSWIGAVMIIVSIMAIIGSWCWKFCAK